MITLPTFDAIRNVPRPHLEQLTLGDNLEQRGWWISDNTMRTLAEMAEVWFNDCCTNDCDGYSNEENCPYGMEYAAACAISQRIREAYKEGK